MTAFSNTETYVWNLFGYDQEFKCYRSVTLYVYLYIKHVSMMLWEDGEKLYYFL